MNLKKFLSDALGAALELGIGTPDDVVRHVTPDVLAQHLPRALWARLLTACLGAPRVDAQLVVETIGIANLCEHVPASILWGCLSEIAQRSLGKPAGASASGTITPAGGVPITTPKQGSQPSRVPLAPPPPEAMRPRAAAAAATPAPSVSIPPVSVDVAVDDDAKPAGARTLAPNRFRQASTGMGRIGQPQARRPQAQAAPAAAPAASTANANVKTVRRGGTEVSQADSEAVDEWRGREIAVDDSQLVDWSTETTEARDDDFSDLGRKR